MQSPPNHPRKIAINSFSKQSKPIFGVCVAIERVRKGFDGGERWAFACSDGLLDTKCTRAAVSRPRCPLCTVQCSGRTRRCNSCGGNHASAHSCCAHLGTRPQGSGFLLQEGVADVDGSCGLMMLELHHAALAPCRAHQGWRAPSFYREPNGVFGGLHVATQGRRYALATPRRRA